MLVISSLGKKKKNYEKVKQRHSSLIPQALSHGEQHLGDDKMKLHSKFEQELALHPLLYIYHLCIK